MLWVMFRFAFDKKKKLSQASRRSQTSATARSPSAGQVTFEAELLTRLGLREGLLSPIEVIQRGKYNSTTSHATLKRFIVKGADNRKISLVLKSAVKDPEARRRHFVTRKFRNEDAFYGHVRNRLLFEYGSLESVNAEEVRNAKQLTKRPLFPTIPKVYGSGLMEGDEFILMEDLVDFSPHPDPQNLDAKHLKASVQALAAFHSASATWRAVSPIEYKAVANLFCETEMMRPDEFDATTDVKTQKVNAALIAAARDCSVHLTGTSVNVQMKLEKVCHSVNMEAPFWVSVDKSQPWMIITHGDCWAKNFLYKYDKNKKITGVAMIDFKCSRAGSPVLDVTNFLLSSASVECLKDLLPFLQKHRSSMNPRLPDYHHHLNKFGTYGLVSALINHYYGVLYVNSDVVEATRLIEVNSEQSEMNDVETVKTDWSKKSLISFTAGKESERSPEKRLPLVVKAARDFKII